MAHTGLGSLVARSARLATGQLPTVALFLALVLASLACAMPAAAQSRGLEPIANPTAPAAAKANYYALVIGINDYPEPLPKLKTAVNDAKSVGSLLHDRYGFHVTYLLDQNATRFKILEALSKYRNTLTDNDSLLIYYAGHGYSDHDAEKAYWLPADADSPTSPNRIIADDLTTGVRVLASRHVLIISDSCYSGALTRDADAPVPSDGESAFIARMLRSRSRTLMASGGDEPVADSGSNGHSVFAYAVLRALSAEDHPVFTASDLFYSSVRQQVAGKSEQMPQYSIIRNSDHDQGDFVFVRSAASASPEVVAAAPPPEARSAPSASVTAPSVPAETAPAPSLTTPEPNAMSPAFALGRGEDLAKQRRYADAAPLLQMACDGGAVTGCTDLGWFYQNGLGVNRNDAEAVNLFRKACDGGNLRGCNNLGTMHEHGTGVGKDEDEAIELYRKACDGGDPMGCRNLGAMYESGRGIGQDDRQAAVFYRKACDGGVPSGCTSLGIDYASGKGVGKDAVQAALILRKACDGGDGNGCSTLSGMYLSGNGIAKDQAQAAALSQKGCDIGFAAACNNLGWIYQTGKGVAPDEAKAVAFFHRSCDLGSGSGCSNLGDAYVAGKGVTKDLAQAATFFRHACDAGDAQGCNNLGVFYFNGSGVGRDDTQAIALMRKACNTGSLKGCNNLGWVYENGRGVAKDMNEAEELYHRACEGGIDDGCKNIKRLHPQSGTPD
jgi:TPR repeat protein/uncharacterized caspase-like protein